MCECVCVSVLYDGIRLHVFAYDKQVKPEITDLITYESKLLTNHVIIRLL